MDLIDHNNLTNKTNDPFPLLVIVITFVAVLILAMLGSVIILGLLSSSGMDLEEVMSSLTSESSISDRNLVRNTLLINHLTTFVLPGIIAAIFCYKSNWLKGLSLNRMPNIVNILLGSLLVFLAFPLVQYTFMLNKSLPLPEWMMGIEDQTKELITNLLITHSPFELFFNVFVIAVVPAIGEEIIFRGILQKQLQRLVDNPHIAILIAAFTFSAIHMQFQGFIPRMLLGALLGYLLYWTGNLWVPIIAHFFNNAFQVIAQYMFSEEMSNVDIDSIETVPAYVALGSLIAVIGLGYLLWKKNISRQTPL